MSEPQPVSNQADVAWERLQELRAEAVELGIEVDDRWPIVQLEAEISRARTS